MARSSSAVVGSHDYSLPDAALSAGWPLSAAPFLAGRPRPRFAPSPPLAFGFAAAAFLAEKGQINFINIVTSIKYKSKKDHWELFPEATKPNQSINRRTGATISLRRSSTSSSGWFLLRGRLWGWIQKKNEHGTFSEEKYWEFKEERKNLREEAAFAPAGRPRFPKNPIKNYSIKFTGHFRHKKNHDVPQFLSHYHFKNNTKRFSIKSAKTKQTSSGLLRLGWRLGLFCKKKNQEWVWTYQR